MLKLVMFCDAIADFRSTSDLVDRVLGESVAWVADLIDSSPLAARRWCADHDQHPFFDLHHLSRYAKKLGTRTPLGHFDGQPGAAGALMARTAFHIARTIAKNEDGLDAVVIVWDMDNDPDGRSRGLEQARDEAQKWAPFRTVVGVQNREREAWMLAGFDAENDDERQLLAELRQELGFAPHLEAHLLDAEPDDAKRSVKRVVRILTGGVWEREEKCWKETHLDTLRERGEGSGLRQFLDEVREQIVPLLGERP